MEKLTPRFWVLTLMVFGAAFLRLLPHPPNFAPIAAMALFGGAYFSKKTFAFIIPLSSNVFNRYDNRNLFLCLDCLFELCSNCCIGNFYA